MFCRRRRGADRGARGRSGRRRDAPLLVVKPQLCHSATGRDAPMTRDQARAAARELLEIMPLVMRTVAAELRYAGELPAPEHFPLLMMLDEQPRTLTELAVLRGVSAPTMSNSITALVQRGWVRRTAPVKDRRVVIVEVTSAGRAALERVGRCAEGHLAEALAPLDAASRRRLQGGLGVLKQVFSSPPPSAVRRKKPPANRG
jgi:DNA-binding MarR family transcriptional regulator